MAKIFSLDGLVDKILFSQERLGKNGRKIKVHKLRTMKQDAELNLERVAANGYSGIGKPIDDDRVTWWGHYLRMFWIDEVPQLCNWLKRDISLVGIRPRPESYWQQFPKEHKAKALIYKPGWVGIQYAHPELLSDHSTIQQMMQMESQYLAQKAKHSFRTDMRYLGKIMYNIFFKGVRSQ